MGYFAGATKNIIVITANGYGTIPVSPGPIAINETTNKIYVASSNGIAVIDGATNSVASTIPDPSATVPTAIAVNPTTNTIYVANGGSNNVTVIDGTTGSVTATVPVGTSPSGVAVNEQTNFIYIANAHNSQTGDPGNVTVINGATNATTTLTDPNAKNPVAVAVNSVTNKIYVANSNSNNVTIIDGAQSQSIQFTLSVAIAGSGTGSVSSNPAGINCGTSCSASFPTRTTVSLTASPASGSEFSGWSGACSGTGACSVTMNAAESVTATFNPTTPPDFSLTPASASLTEPRGGQMTDVITVAPQNGGFASAIQLSCTVSGPSPMPTCALSPASVTPGANSATSTLTITAPAASAMLRPIIRGRLKFLYAAWLPLPGIVLFGIALISRKQRDRRRNLWLHTVSLIILFAVLAGCGGGSSGPPPPPPPQNYTVTITGTSGAIQHTTQVTVIVP